MSSQGRTAYLKFCQNLIPGPPGPTGPCCPGPTGPTGPAEVMGPTSGVNNVMIYDPDSTNIYYNPDEFVTNPM